ncbi:hypothetical protein COU78_05405 [Candidatus Peregrinibacteria bacterium CG10_big_fil_rev_8_21_14_0_10_49_24]|nr:MAG: hypothetical protein COV83_01775 [Candidatus Peregrinibacteria bacterium CG11_big_fil_rev_8_21_14_0_20_49_14]PIR50781.1 MAG: hypothetical protein COU78_05405 [Candidatus Peregrinibacteria bacterium CG10_big_fil_rev_8_21_14_0_10_49_24]PJA68174.1 MAG: hypothetical protein CO157_00405 [Candidatus Peregrinibacteria bacterium CG_4_9_14_3_um_filter_49_12]
MNATFLSVLKKPTALWGLGFATLLVAKFLWPLFTYDIPLGYDPGIYRYLFLRHAEGFPPFFIGEMDAWAHNHPLGLFFFSTILLRAGLPVDWFLGFIWNLFPIVLIATYAWITSRKEGATTGILVLLVGALSVPLYDGFSAMYWKTFAALLFAIWTFYLLEKKSLLAIVPGILTLVTHNQTGLLFALTVGTWWAIQMIHKRNDPTWRKASLIGGVVLILAALAYLPVWKQAVGDHLLPLLTMRGDDVPAGSFPPVNFYMKMNGLLLLAGVYGCIVSFKKQRRATLWILAVLWSAAFVFLRLFFYRRFFLQLDFFLMPFAAIAIADCWKRLPSFVGEVVLISFIAAQGYLSYQVLLLRQPDIDAETFAIVSSLHTMIPEDALVLTLENKSTTWVRGWLPQNNVAGPGLFSLPWSRDRWEQLLFGTHEEKEALLGLLPGKVYFVLTPLFYSYYGEFADAFIADSCFEKLQDKPLLLVTCAR